MSSQEKPTVQLATMCQKHQTLLVHQAGFSKSDPWRALIIVAQIVLFQAMTCDEKIRSETEGELEKFVDYGCMACVKPDAFGEIVEAAKSHDLGSIKRLGESWVFAKGKTNEPQGN